MLRKLSPVQIGGILLLAVFTVFITWRAKKMESNFGTHDSASAMMHRKAPDFSLLSNEGRSISLADYRGKKRVVLSYWASWCGPCRLELPQLRDFYRKYHREDSDFEVLAVSVDEDTAAANAFANQAKLPFPILFDPSSKAADAYSVEAIPTIYVIDKDGTVTYANTGVEETLEIQLALRLGIKPSSPGLATRDDTNHDSSN
jgi:peroxiredoxin